jgi:hypothetical protein
MNKREFEQILKDNNYLPHPFLKGFLFKKGVSMGYVFCLNDQSVIVGRIQSNNINLKEGLREVKYYSVSPYTYSLTVSPLKKKKVITPPVIEEPVKKREKELSDDEFNDEFTFEI